MSTAPRVATYFHIHLVSDSTGETLNAMARAVCAICATGSGIACTRAIKRAQWASKRAGPFTLGAMGGFATTLGAATSSPLAAA